MQDAVHWAQNQAANRFDYLLSHEVEPFQSKFIFQDINFYMHVEDFQKTTSSAQCIFFQNQIVRIDFALFHYLIILYSI